ncbi:IMPACT family protein [Polycladidibacter hongkongensis]|uniref:IMPACT family protein n=1 Tax=Polycladidibacter hongkongensis TaxID=1647556 RepID=UPI00083055C0|nr:YigZ family protein [Pseudovibrio hongkongensis]
MPLQTIKDEFYCETEEKKSRFLAFLVPIETFDSRLAQLRAEHRKANHHVTAFRRMLPDDRIDESAKDDGEPAGTSGMPMLKTLIGHKLINTGVIVVRYFGGIKLGTGGLARAYSGAANAVIAQATLQPWEKILAKTVSASFSQSAELERQVSLLGLSVLNREFTEGGVCLHVSGPEEKISQL